MEVRIVMEVRIASKGVAFKNLDKIFFLIEHNYITQNKVCQPSQGINVSISFYQSTSVENYIFIQL